MSQLAQWDAVDRYITELFLAPDAALEHALARSETSGLPSIHVSPSQGKFLHLLARACGAKRILEIGTLGGYSTIWLARSLPHDGKLTTLEINPKHAEVARENIERAGLSDTVEIRLGSAYESLATLVAEGSGPFDFIFIDADKEGTTEYFSRALELSRLGSLIVVDNVVRGGKVADTSFSDPNIEGIRRFHESLATETRISAIEIQTVGTKGYDGFALAVVVAEN
jgi:predicted O-methyltransferase YrrM